jgi:hypothetical protein
MLLIQPGHPLWSANVSTFWLPLAMTMNEPPRAEFPEDSIPPPKGTLFVLGLYMLVLAVGWGVMFLLLVNR